ncbi:F-box only protein 16 isoform X2 [Scleropages formosus]|uniref:F-box only protein 16 isoform X2 n=1 Tax=Scleropages formosus TaxID=113540 RepID=UPI0008791C73|nr:F-box only protein 16 isoform X2 [Scleropages formosus]
MKANWRNRKMRTTMSTWTPLNHQLSNDHVFEERRELLGKWFDKWTDSQRKRILQDFFSRCTVAQLRFVRDNACDQVPKEAVDFATLLPRIVSLYIFSFLDPRSLCRCAQVSWHWRSLVELDQLWMPKCLRLGWCINFSPTPFEQAVWKRHYIETVQQLHVTKPKSPSQQGFVIPDVKVIGSEGEKLTESCHRGVQQRGKETQRKDPPPWRDSDRHPTDTLRFNYLQNDDPIFQTRFLHTKKNSSTIMNQEIIKRKPLSDSMYKLRKMFLSPELNPGHQRQKRPDWATLRSQEYPITKETAKKLAQRPQWNAGIRPGPARQAVPRMSAKGLKASQRSQRSSPSVPLFEGQSWKSPPLEQGSEAH